MAIDHQAGAAVITVHAKAVEQLMRLIAEVTAKDMAHKSLSELFASVVEEAGEVSRAMLVEKQTFGHAYKRLDESASSECVDLWICALAVYFAVGGDIAETCATAPDYPESAAKEAASVLAHRSRDGGPIRGVFKMLSAAVKAVGETGEAVDYADWNPEDEAFADDVKRAAAELSADTLMLFFTLGGTIEELLSVGNAKMAKWAASQQ